MFPGPHRPEFIPQPPRAPVAIRAPGVITPRPTIVHPLHTGDQLGANALAPPAWAGNTAPTPPQAAMQPADEEKPTSQPTDETVEQAPPADASPQTQSATGATALHETVSLQGEGKDGAVPSDVPPKAATPSESPETPTVLVPATVPETSDHATEATAAPEPVRSIEYAAEITASWLTRYGRLSVVPEEQIRDIALTSHNPMRDIEAAYGTAILAEIRGRRREHPKSYTEPSRRPADDPEIVQYKRNIVTIKGYLAAAAGYDPRVDQLDADLMATRMARDWTGFARDDGASLLAYDTGVLLKAVDAYCADTLAFADAGFRRPEILAEFNEAAEIVAQLAISDDPAHDITLADTRPSDPLSAMRTRRQASIDLKRQYAEHPLTSPELIRRVINTGRPEGASIRMRSHIQKLEALQEADRPGTDVLLQHLQTQLPKEGIDTAIAGYFRAYSIVDQASARIDVVDKTAVGHLSWRLRERPNADALRTMLKTYQAAHTRLIQNATAVGILLSPHIISKAAAKHFPSPQQRLAFAISLQLELKPDKK